MSKNCQDYKGFAIRHIARGDQWQAHYWRRNVQYGITYETMLTDTPEDARRLARLTIDGQVQPVYTIVDTAPIDAAIRAQFGERGA